MFVLLGSCVSVDIGPKDPTKSKNIDVAAPASPFEEVTADHVDRAWRNTKNGNTISYLSECNLKIEPTLEDIKKGVISDLMNASLVNEENLLFNRRQALASELSGKIDGVDTRIDLLIFKKNSCTYILTYVALSTTYTENKQTFETFKTGFKVK